MPQIYPTEYLFKEECYKIIGCSMEVHKTLGNGFLEAVYQEALALEFADQKIPFQREKEIEIQYKNKVLSKKYCADFLCFDQIIVELKAISELTENNYKQLFNYLKATNLKLGLIINFGNESLEYKRIIK
jgi:GxxExxY protein